MTAQEAKQRLERIWKAYTSAYDTVSIEDLLAFDMATNSLGAIEQIQWERDMAIKQLHDLGYGLGEKPREELNNSSQEVKKSNKEVKKSNDLIGRQDAIDAVTHITSSMSVCVNADECHGMKRMQRQAVIELANLPSAQTESCEGCIQYGLWENEIEYGYPSPCTRCKRRANDNYER